MKQIVLILPMFLLAACGGDSVTDSAEAAALAEAAPFARAEFNPTTNDGRPVVVKTYNDGSGIIALTQTINGDRITTTSYVDDTAGAIFSVPGATNFSNVVNVSSRQKGEFYKATATANNTQTDVYYYELDNGEATFALGDGCTGPCAASDGDAPTSLLAGTWVYTGDFATVPTGTASTPVDLSDSDNISNGTFTLNADFTDASATISAANDSSEDTIAILASNNIEINMRTGTFEGDGTLKSPSNLGGNGNEWDADIHGSFHGDEATSVSGVFATTVQTNRGIGSYLGHVSGAFAGTRN